MPRKSKKWVNSFTWFTTAKKQKIGIRRGVDNIKPKDIVAPQWYKHVALYGSEFIKVKNLCPMCGRGLKKGICGEHGDPKLWGWKWNVKKKKWIKNK